LVGLNPPDHYFWSATILPDKVMAGALAFSRKTSECLAALTQLPLVVVL
jgi:hypothetical protein